MAPTGATEEKKFWFSILIIKRELRSLKESLEQSLGGSFGVRRKLERELGEKLERELKREFLRTILNFRSVYLELEEPCPL